MSIPTPTSHRVAALVLLIGCLVLLADGTARVELAQAVGLSWPTGSHTLTYATDLRN